MPAGKAGHIIPVFLYDEKVLFIGQVKCFYLVVDKEGHLYYYKNKENKQMFANKCFDCDRRFIRKIMRIEKGEYLLWQEKIN